MAQAAVCGVLVLPNHAARKSNLDVVISAVPMFVDAETDEEGAVLSQPFNAGRSLIR